MNNPRARRVLPAAPRGFCAGVDRAVLVVEEALRRHGPPVYVRRQIVHNLRVVRGLEERGAVFVAELDEVPEGSVVVFSAHGVSPAVRAQATARGLTVLDATCNLVARVHAEARRFAAHDHLVVLIGHEEHEEVQGAVKAVAGDLVLVVGSRNSSNSKRLVEVALRAGAGAAHLVEDAGNIDPRWLDGVSTVGVSSGASAPEHLVREVLTWLADRGFDQVEEVEVMTETEYFALPSALR